MKCLYTVYTLCILQGLQGLQTGSYLRYGGAA